jgi:hypothetical protein
MFTAGLGLFSGIKDFNSGLEIYFRKRKYQAVPTKGGNWVNIAKTYRNTTSGSRKVSYKELTPLPRPTLVFMIL